MAKLRYEVQQEFKAWKPERRDDRAMRLPMRAGLPVLADLDVNGDFIQFEMDSIDYETDRHNFLNSTRLAHPDEIPPPPY